MKIYIEANIGSGKTTFLTLLKNYKFKNLDLIQEPVDEWVELKDDNGIDILDNFYQDQVKWSFSFQMNSFISRAHRITENYTSNICLAERSVFTDKNCFASNCYETGKMNKIEWDIYTRWHAWLVQKFNLNADAYIYLRTEPEICLERIKKRSRTGESNIPLEYLQLLHNKHESWMKQENVPVLTIDTNKDFNNSTEMDNMVKMISDFIENNFNTKLQISI